MFKTLFNSMPNASGDPFSSQLAGKLLFKDRQKLASLPAANPSFPMVAVTAKNTAALAKTSQCRNAELGN